MKYEFSKIEKRAQKIWEERKIFQTTLDIKKPKYYVLDMFPYPSGDGLHVGHVKLYTATDVISHYYRLKGYNVLHPTGWDAFGLPAENYAIKVKKNPAEVVEANVQRFKNQMRNLGFSYDWSREINTTDPEYYKWTQWIFIKMFEEGLAYQAETPINFCPSCKTGLANEEVISGECERCGTRVEKRSLKQWILRITKYADRLLEDLCELNWPEPIIEMQKNWIGRSEGTDIVFKLNVQEELKVYTTRADTLFGCTYLVVAPEHEMITKYKDKINNYSEVSAYIDSIKAKSELERTDLAKEKTGIEIKGITATNPVNNRTVPIFVADYVLGHYGTGAVMAVPAHDERDFDFAKKYNLDIKFVIGPAEDKTKAKTDYGILNDSEEFNNLKSEDAIKKITQKLKDIGQGDFTVNYKLRDWIFSRQRYWGEPIPVIHCDKCGPVAVDTKDLPVKLPYLEDYEPTGTGESPLAKVKEWVNTTCPRCGGNGKRETNTMPNWAGSCWYYLRFADPKNKNELISKEADEYFSPVDFYLGGAEHAVLHLLYARFWHKFLYDIKVVKDLEPFKKLQNVGLILAPDRQKMSKSRGNVINPDDVVKTHGADALRMYEMFIGPFDQPAVWSKNGIVGTYKYLEKVESSFNIAEKEDSRIETLLNELIASISEKIEKGYFNTAISDFMKFSNDVDLSSMSASQWERFVVTLAPFAPHLCEDLYQKISSKGSIFESSWPKSKRIEKTKINYVVQINGKKKAVVEVDSTLEKNQILGKIHGVEIVKNALNGKTVKKEVFIENKLVNFVI